MKGFLYFCHCRICIVYHGFCRRNCGLERGKIFILNIVFQILTFRFFFHPAQFTDIHKGFFCCFNFICSRFFIFLRRIVSKGFCRINFYLVCVISCFGVIFRFLLSAFFYQIKQPAVRRSLDKPRCRVF